MSEAIPASLAKMGSAEWFLRFFPRPIAHVSCGNVCLTFPLTSQFQRARLNLINITQSVARATQPTYQFGIVQALV